MEFLHRDLSKEGMRGKEQEQRSEQQVSEDRRGDRQKRIYIGIDIRNTSLKTDGETESRDSTQGSIERERWEETERVTAQM